MKESTYKLKYWYGYGYRTYQDIVWAKNKKQAIKKIMLSIAKSWSFCFGGGFQLFSIEKKGEWEKTTQFYGEYKGYSFKVWKELKTDNKFVNKYKHYLWDLIEKGKIKDETNI